MHVLTVIPFSRGGQNNELTYFSAQPGNPGDFVLVPIRARQVPGLIIRCKEVADVKSEIRGAGYALKKVATHPYRGLVEPAAITAGVRLAEWHATASSAVFAGLIANALLDEHKVPKGKKKTELSAPQSEEPRLAAEKLVLQCSREERIERYRALARSEFARGGSCLLVAPTMAEADSLYAVLRRGIEPYTILLRSGLPAKVERAALATLTEETHPLLIVATPAFGAVRRADIKMIALEREDAGSWRGLLRPHIDFRLFAEFLAEARGVRFLLAGEPLSVSTMHRYERGELEALAPVSRRRSGKTPFEIVDVRKKEDEPKKPYSVFSEVLRASLQHLFAERSRIILLATRRSLAPITICADCGRPVLCPFSETPMALHKTAKGNVFVCRACGEVRTAAEACRTCGSWKLTPLGVGIERVEDECRTLFPAVPVQVIERERTTTPVQIKKAIAAFFAEKEGGILLGTEMMLPYLDQETEAAAVVSMDSVLAMPEWSAYERAYSILLRLSEAAKKGVLVQSRMPDAPILTYATEGDLSSFYKMEFASRQALGYPPFGIFIKISVEGGRAAVEKELEAIAKHLEPLPLLGAGRPLHIGGTTYRLHGFLRLPRQEWPDAKVVAKLRALPSSVAVVVDPDSVL